MGTILAGNDRENAFECTGFGHIETGYLAMADGTSENASDQGIGVVEIRRVAGAPGHLLDTVDEGNPGAAQAPFVFGRKLAHGAISAAARTDSMILT
jgi:hypothetical protein